MARLIEPIDLKVLSEEGLVFQVDSDCVRDHDSDDEEEDEEPTEILERNLQQSNKECVGVFDEDIYQEGEPFEIISSKMFNLIPCGKIKKRMIREGQGDAPEEYAVVKINYNGYLEYEDAPFDSTYIRKKPLQFTINAGKVIAGLEFAVRSMAVNEKSQFLIAPEYAYGKNCSLGRIPSDATVLFEVELLEIVNSGATIMYEQLPEDQQKTFPEVYKYCTALCEKGKKSFLNRDFKSAIKDYNIAVSKLEKVILANREYVEEHRELSLKLYTNLVICYTQSGQLRKCCAGAKKIYNLTENGEVMKIPTKVYFNHAKCLRILSEYDEAAITLEKARRREPRNPEIANEVLNLEKDKSEHMKKSMAFAKFLIGQSRN